MQAVTFVLASILNGQVHRHQQVLHRCGVNQRRDRFHHTGLGEPVDGTMAMRRVTDFAIADSTIMAPRDNKLPKGRLDRYFRNGRLVSLPCISSEER